MLIVFTLTFTARAVVATGQGRAGGIDLQSCRLRQHEVATRQQENSRSRESYQGQEAAARVEAGT